MANATATQPLPTAYGSAGGPTVINLPVKGAATIYKGTLVAQHSGGYYVPYSAAGAGIAVGVAQHDQDNATGADGDKRISIETHRIYALPNGSAGDAFSDVSVLGAPVYALDDHTAVADNSSSATRKCIGFFMGFDADGKVRVLIDPRGAFLVNALATLTDTPASADALRDNIVAQML